MYYQFHSFKTPDRLPMDFPQLICVDEGRTPPFKSKRELQEWLQNRVSEVRSRASLGQILVWMSQQIDDPSASHALGDGWVTVSNNHAGAFVAIESAGKTGAATVQFVAEGEALFVDAMLAR